MDDSSSFKKRVDAMRRSIDGGLSVIAEATQLALEGLAGDHDPEAVILACICAAHAMKNTQPARALQLLQRARRLAASRGLQADAVALRLRMAEAHLSGGDHAEGFDQLVALAGSPDLNRMSPLMQSRLFLVLAVHSLAVDPDDSVSLCLRLAGQTWHAGEAPMPPDHVAWALAARMMRLSFAHDCMHTLLARPHWDAERRVREARALGRDAAAALARTGWDAVAVCTRSWTEIIAALAPALAERDAAAVRRTLDLMRTLPDDDPHQQEDGRYWAIAALLELGALDAAQAALDAMEPVQAAEHWALRLYWLHLRSALARARGDTATALRDYEAYVAAASRQLPRMNMRVPQLLKSLTRLPGGRPSEAADERPAYLDRALSLVAGTEETPTVAALAAAAGVSERTLREAFVTHLGLAPKDYLLRQRLHAARATLELAPDLSVEEAAARHGFSNPGRFAAQYRAAFGRSPGRTRRP